MIKHMNVFVILSNSEQTTKGSNLEQTTRGNNLEQTTRGSNLEQTTRANTHQHEDTTARSSVALNNKDKIILWYVKTRYQPPMPGLVALQHCPEMKCRMTSNRKYLNQSSAVVFAAQLIREKHPPLKHPGQVWIFHNHESPLDGWSSLPTFRLPQWKGKFNWTMDYRNEADILSPYGILKKLPQPRKRNYSDIVSKKKGLVSWMVSNCNTEGKRELYVKKIKKYFPVTVLGGCGGKRCGRLHDDECLSEINKHKFYLAFENGFCPDYITEKFYRFYSVDVVPVVRGGGNYSRDLPEGTYVNTADFKSVADLAKYLNYLDKNDDKYIEYLRRKDQYESIYEAYKMSNKKGNLFYVHYHYEHTPFCDVCRRLWNTDNYTKTYSDIGAWFDSGRCYKPTDIHQL
ncbi:3-galactosyl-N-acetylglucosaminide 4-alpha-L-fucosyltransferase FUT3-like [Gigantopelta aegis]|uniref:3-galactosyl-N-acetylglucosaminide 4-alpha-L-fucosyltransferase FUT3-like n=1 Tax=Gigantopelta aegis TaxID=1735272 RepID=UPI001B888567|nr:3-galactosyl-N-acetylglucosaminide 4-alpha-L-fucosyltransferase FUT3-like [Gigantopelta aegis]